MSHCKVGFLNRFFSKKGLKKGRFFEKDVAAGRVKQLLAVHFPHHIPECSHRALF